MRRSVTLLSTWTAATLAAVGLAWAGVGLVADQVAEPVRPLASASLATTAASEAPEATEALSPTGGPSEVATTADASEGAGATPEPTPAPTAVPAAPRSPAAADPAGDSGSESEPASSAAPAETRSYQLVGGTVTIRFTSTLVDVVVATPAEGFDVEVERDGPTELQVEFESEEHRSRLDAWWAGGPRERVREDAE